jgi:adenosylmethionine-8-amino-7-oxononanoate aminotransferase
MGHKVALAARGHEVMLRPLGNVVVLMPPLSIKPQEVDFLVDGVREAIAEATAP